MKTESEHPKSKHRDHSLVLKLLMGAVTGFTLIFSLKTGWAKMLGKSKGTKPHYTVGDAPYFGALGGIIGVAAKHEQKSRTYEKQLVVENASLKECVRLIDKKETFEQRVRDQRDQQASIRITP